MSKFRFPMQLKLCFAFVIALLLISCSPAGVREQGTEDASGYTRLEDIPELLEKADAAVGEERAELRLTAAEALIIHGETDWARNTLSELLPETLTDEHFLRYSILSAKVAIAEGRHFVAYNQLFNERFDRTIGGSRAELRQQALDLRASLLYDIAEYRESVKQRILLDTLLTDPNEKDLNQDLLWQALMELPQEDLRMESQMQSGHIAKGWYTLAALSKDNQTNLQQQLQEVDDWIIAWPNHPASARLPADLQLLRQLVAEQPQQIALLLPVSGKLGAAAQAVRDGFMAAYYEASATGRVRLPDIRVYDTATGDVNELYDNAVLEGAQMVVGPLDKENIDKLINRPVLPVPTLALNYVDDSDNSPDKLYQFGLAPEDEARQVAERAWRDGHRRALILAPASNWGDRSVTAFGDAWTELGGELVHHYRYTPQEQYSQLIKQALNIAESEQRASRIRQIIGRNIEFEPRRRQDIDVIFLVAHQAQARQIKPTLAFHYAGNIPVYATSQIYNGEDDSKANQDMNAIRFVTLPWFFDENLPEKRSIDRYANDSPAFQRLYALGVDAFHLHPRLRQLAAVSQSHFYGATGTLSLDKNRRVVREQTWAQFIKGQAYAMPTVTQDDNDIQL